MSVAASGVPSLDELGLHGALPELAITIADRATIPIERCRQRDLPMFKDEELVIYRVA